MTTIVTALVPKRVLADTEHFFAVEEETGEAEDTGFAPTTRPLPAEGS